MDRCADNTAIPKRCTRRVPEPADPIFERQQLGMRLSIVRNRIRECPDEAQSAMQALEFAACSRFDVVQ